jgi:hypothetical protein
VTPERGSCPQEEPIAILLEPDGSKESGRVLAVGLKPLIRSDGSTIRATVDKMHESNVLGMRFGRGRPGATSSTSRDAKLPA